MEKRTSAVIFLEIPDRYVSGSPVQDMMLGSHVREAIKTACHGKDSQFVLSTDFHVFVSVFQIKDSFQMRMEKVKGDDTVKVHVEELPHN